ncbi:MAG: 50S ribosomal protein L19e [Nanoarchaeota archaeon]
MQLTVQRRLASEILKCSPKRVQFDEAQLEIIKESITKADVRALIDSGAIVEKPVKGVSRGRARKSQSQRAKGRQRGQGTRKGTANARESQKDKWLRRVRLQRAFIKELREKELISVQTYRSLYQKVKGGFFRNKRHIKLYLGERKLIQGKEE